MTQRHIYTCSVWFERDGINKSRVKSAWVVMEEAISKLQEKYLVQISVPAVNLAVRGLRSLMFSGELITQYPMKEFYSILIVYSVFPTTIYVSKWSTRLLAWFRMHWYIGWNTWVVVLLVCEVLSSWKYVYTYLFLLITDDETFDISYIYYICPSVYVCNCNWTSTWR